MPKQSSLNQFVWFEIDKPNVRFVQFRLFSFGFRKPNDLTTEPNLKVPKS